jgi:hypothetical protein
MEEGISRNQLEKELKQRFELTYSEDGEILDYVWDRYADDPSIGLPDLIGLAEGPIIGYLIGKKRASAGRSPDSKLVGSGSVDFSDELRGGDEGGNEYHTASELHKGVATRVEGFSEYVSKIADVDPWVVGFRDRVLGGPTYKISLDAAHTFVHSPAARFFPLKLFGELNISPLEHDATLERHDTVQEDGENWHRVTIFFGSHGIRRTVSFSDPGEDSIVSLRWPGDSEYADRIAVWQGSVLGELQRVSKRLARRFPWKEDQAAYFVLCGGNILAGMLMGTWSSHINKGVHAHQYDRTTITLTADSWLPAETVFKAYRRLQRQVHGGKNNRRPELRNVAVFRFVLDQSEIRIVSREERLAKLELPKWRVMLRRWNEQHPRSDRWHYENPDETGVQRFQRDFVRGQKAVIGTRFGLPGVPGQPMTRADAKAGDERMIESLSRPGTAFVEVTEEEES